MSQIAEGFLVPDVAMQEAAACAGRNDARGMRALLRPHAFEAFGWSGYVLFIATEWLREQGVTLPRSTVPSIQDIVDRYDPLLCANGAECEVLARRLNGFSPSTEELVQYWSEMAGETEEASQFMPDAWAWLNRLVRSGTQSDWCLLFEG
ncbi:MAG TPA: hypothetical protein VKR31_06600 [Rhizomicrobium sp.]|nr:hypothetical protein [Rhizomicrobium sp.]